MALPYPVENQHRSRESTRSVDAKNWTARRTMADELKALLQFKELHLLSRVLWGVGAALFVASLFHGYLSLSFLGLTLVFASVGYNIWFDWYRSKNDLYYDEDGKTLTEDQKRKVAAKRLTERKFLKGHASASLLLALLLFGAFAWRLHHYHRHHRRAPAPTDEFHHRPL
jgi:hypothetical protein